MSFTAVHEIFNKSHKNSDDVSRYKHLMSSGAWNYMLHFCNKHTKLRNVANIEQKSIILEWMSAESCHGNLSTNIKLIEIEQR